MRSFIITLLGAAILVPLPGNCDTVELELQCDRPWVEAGKEQTVLVKIAARGRELPVADRAPVNLSLVIDKSGSMSGDRIVNARKGAIEAIRRLGRDDIFSVVVYDSRVETLIPAGRLTDIERVERIINGITAAGTTNIHGGLEAGFAELEKNFDRRHLNRMVLLSDGLANVGPTRPEAFAELGRTFSGKGVVISTVGLGLDYNERLMADLARAGEGNNYFVHDAGSLPKIFREEIGHLVGTVARGVIIRIEIPDGVEVERVLGRGHRREGRMVEIDFHDLAAGHRKYSLLELRVPGGADGEVLPPFRATASYRRATDDVMGQVEGQAEVRYTASARQVERTVRPEVRDAWAELRQADLQEEVLDLVAQGRREDARGALRRVSDEAAGLGWSAMPPALEKYRLGEEEILMDRDFSPEEVRSRRAESYQLRTQQATGRE